MGSTMCDAHSQIPTGLEPIPYSRLALARSRPKPFPTPGFREGTLRTPERNPKTALTRLLPKGPIS